MRAAKEAYKRAESALYDEIRSAYKRDSSHGRMARIGTAADLTSTRIGQIVNPERYQAQRQKYAAKRRNAAAMEAVDVEREGAA
ncbi:hypothetical protein CK936_15815 [Streptomyces albireticuli]|uniref:Uncharacterized protein n=1 Tax=Streptomyces albireticuli TaxID=1940 RepID=A0A2A2D8Y3_9ACTN|nr:hypothetical protein CK936_15815 [Streptomyces albireticuli]